MGFFSNLRSAQIQQAQLKTINDLLVPKIAEEYGNTDVYCRMSQWLPPTTTGNSVLELGCGPGRYVAMLSAFGYQVTAADPFNFPSWDTIKKVYKPKFDVGVKAESLPYEDSSFDNVACLGTVLYLQNPNKAFEEIRRVIRLGGVLIIRTVNKTNLYTVCTGKKMDPASNNLYTMKELISLVESSGFKVVDSFYYEFRPPFLTNIWWYFQNVFLGNQSLEWLSSIIPHKNRAQISIKAVAV